MLRPKEVLAWQQRYNGLIILCLPSRFRWPLWDSCWLKPIRFSVRPSTVELASQTLRCVMLLCLSDEGVYDAVMMTQPHRNLSHSGLYTLGSWYNNKWYSQFLFSIIHACMHDSQTVSCFLFQIDTIVTAVIFNHFNFRHPVYLLGSIWFHLYIPSLPWLHGADSPFVSLLVGP